MSDTVVYLKEKKEHKIIRITSESKPKITEITKNKWQRIIDVVAEILKVPAGLIMRVSRDNIEVFVKSSNEFNPYKSNEKSKLGLGFYCETVLGTNSELLVVDALKKKAWKDSPDVILNMISYYGLPIKWTDGELFGTICVLDTDENEYNDQYKELLSLIRDAIEADLEILILNDDLKKASLVDYLTDVYNRKMMDTMFESCFKFYQRNKEHFCCILMNLDYFKKINDEFGHEIGDDVLKGFAKVVKNRVRDTDYFGRYGGDEFILLIRDNSYKEAILLVKDIEILVQKDKFLSKYNVAFTYGISRIDKNFSNVEEFIMNADKKMIDEKHRKKVVRK